MDEEKAKKFLNKKWILIILALIIIIGGLIYLASPKIDTDIDVSSFDPSSATDTGEVLIRLTANDTDDNTTRVIELDNKTVFLNLTDKKNHTSEYNGTTDQWGTYKIWNIKSGNYTYCAIFPGDDEYKSSIEEGNLTIKKFVPSNVTSYYVYRNVTSYNITVPKYETRYVVRYVYV